MVKVIVVHEMKEVVLSMSDVHVIKMLIEFDLFDMIRSDEDIDNIFWLRSLMNVYSIVEKIDKSDDSKSVTFTTEDISAVEGLLSSCLFNNFYGRDAEDYYDDREEAKESFEKRLELYRKIVTQN